MPNLKKRRSIPRVRRGGPPANLGRAMPARQVQRIARKEALRDRRRVGRHQPRPPVRPAAPPRRVMAPRPPASLNRNRATRPVQKHRQVARPMAAAGLGVLALNAAAAHPSLASNVQFLQSSLERLQNTADFQSIEQDIDRLQADIDNMIALLESAREKDYAFQADIDESAYQAVSTWQSVVPQVRQSLPQQTAALQARLRTLSSPVAQLNVVLGNPTAGRDASQYPHA